MKYAIVAVTVLSLCCLSGCADNTEANISMIRETVQVAKDAKLSGQVRAVVAGHPLSWSTQTAIGQNATVTAEIDFDFTEDN
jgi:outer membrane murein-binding lipoprotein Lpp